MTVYPSFFVPGNRTQGVAGKGFPRISAEEIEKPAGVSKRSRSEQFDSPWGYHEVHARHDFMASHSDLLNSGD